MREYSLKPFLCTSAPGRADFLNTHQDYKGLPVVPVAISLRTYMFALKRTRGYFRIESLNLKDEGRKYIDKFSVKSPKIKAG
ncbi:MAG: GHMP kinase, partial [Thermoprotei archaeon]